MTTHAVILAGGKGTRLAPYTATIPKPLIPIGEYPILEIILRQLRHHGIRDITLTLGHMASLIESYFGDGKRFGLRIKTSTEKKPLGTAGPLSLLRGLPENIVVLNGDLFTTANIRKMIQYHEKRHADATIGLYREAVVQQNGVITTNHKSQIVRYDEKPTTNVDISMGIYILSRRAISLIPKNKFYNLPDLINDLINKNRPIFGFRSNAEWLDIGRPADYSRAVDLFKKFPKRYLKK